MRLMRHTRTPLSQPRSNEEGTAFILLAVVVIIVVWLAAIAVDASAIFLAHRELSNAAQTAANNAVSGIDENSYFGSGAYLIETGSTGRAERMIKESLGAQSPKTDTGRFTNVSSNLTVRNGRLATVVVTADVRRPMLGGMPGFSRFVTIRAEATAQAVVDDGTP